MIIYDMIFNHPNHIRETFTHPFFSSSRRFSARALVATQKPQTATRQRCDAMSSCRPKCTFFCTLVDFFLWSIDIGRHFLKCFHVPPICWVPVTMVPIIGFTPQTTSKMISLSQDILFVVDLGHLEPFVGLWHNWLQNLWLHLQWQR